MKTMKNICWILSMSMLLKISAFGQDIITEDIFTRGVGTWHSERTNSEGKRITGLRMTQHEKSLELLLSYSLNFDAETKTLVSSSGLISRVDSTGKQIQALAIISDGFLAKGVGIINGNHTLVQIMGTSTNKTSGAFTLNSEMSQDGNSITDSMSNLIFGGNYAETIPGEVTWSKIDGLENFIQANELVIPEGTNDGSMKERFGRLEGNWARRDDQDVVTLAINWNITNMGGVLLERWGQPSKDEGQIEGGGINITAIDPSNGQLTMWSAGKGGIFRTGGWDSISDNISGQRQGNNRLIREFKDDNTITVYWQSKKNGEYSGESGKYTLHRIGKGDTTSEEQSGTKLQNDPKAKSFDLRLKEAQKPFTYLRADKMKVMEGMDEEYLEIERQWKEIHEKLMSDGKMLSWSLWKPKDKNLGYDYVTVQTYDSLDSMDTPYNWEKIGESIGADNLNVILQKTPNTRKNIGSELWKLEGWTRPGENVLPDALSIGFMTPAEGKDAQYAQMETKYFSKFWQAVTDVDDSILGWHFSRLLFSNGEKVDYKYYTLHLKDSSKKSIDGQERNNIWNKINSDFPPNIKMNELRQMKGVDFELVIRADPSNSAISKEWQKLQGSWKHTYQNGSYRIKRISPYREVLENYSKDGVKQGNNVSPMKIEIKGGLKYFYSIHPNGTWRSIYHIKDGKWYEQLRGIFGETNAKPDDFLIYEKVD